MRGLLKRAFDLGYSTKSRLDRGRQRRRKERSARRLGEINAFDERFFSQNGEDGIIREIFARIPHRRYFVEIGVEDGSECNSARLSRFCNWSGLLVEGNGEVERALRERFAAYDVRVEIAYVDRENIAAILEKHEVPYDLGLLSIDVDGNDLFLWRALAAYRAACVVIEYNAFFGPTRSLSIAYDATHRYGGDRYFGASLAALERVGRELGYALVGTDARGVNAFFLRDELLQASGFARKSAAQAYRKRPFFGRFLPARSGPLVEV